MGAGDNVEAANPWAKGGAPAAEVDAPPEARGGAAEAVEGAVEGRPSASGAGAVEEEEEPAAAYYLRACCRGRLD